MDSFTNISKSMVDQRLEFGPQAVFGILEMMCSSNHNFGAQRKKRVEKIGMQNYSAFCIVDAQRSRSFGHFLIIYDETRCGI